MTERTRGHGGPDGRTSAAAPVDRSVNSRGDGQDDRPAGDPWHAFGYVVSGVAVYGLLGWLADRWLETTGLVAVGILVGAGLGIFMTFARFNRPFRTPSSDHRPAQQD
jgi:hypothetical protein